MSERFIEKLFLKHLENITIEPDILKDISSLEKETPAIQKINDLEQELELLNKRRKKWQYAWVNEMLTDEEFSERMSGCYKSDL